MAKQEYDLFIIETSPHNWKLEDDCSPKLVDNRWFHIEGIYEKQAPDLERLLAEYNRQKNKSINGFEEYLRRNIQGIKITCSVYETQEGEADTKELNEILERIRKDRGLGALLSAVEREKAKDILKNKERKHPN